MPDSAGSRLLRTLLVVVAGLVGLTVWQATREASPPPATPAAAAPAEDTDQEPAIVRLEPSAFPGAPRAVRDSLAAMGCRVPQSYEYREPHNVVRGRFAVAGQTDWAALCSRGGESGVVLFWGGPARCPSVLPPSPDLDWVQGMGPEGNVYSQVIGARDPDAIRRLAEAFDGPEPPPLDHDGLSIAFAGKASEILYCHEGRWIALQGMD